MQLNTSEAGSTVSLEFKTLLADAKYVYPGLKKMTDILKIESTANTMNDFMVFLGQC